MNQVASLRRAIQDLELPHSFFDKLHIALMLRIEDALDGFAPSVDLLVGPSRVGKTMLIHSLAREFLEVTKDGFRHVPVLVVPVPTPATPKQLPRSVLKALGAPLPTAVTGVAQMFERMARQLKLAGTRVILFEEASHIVDVGTKVPPRAAGDWFKQLTDVLGISVVLFGVPRLTRLLESNEQLRLRSGAVMQFRPYAWTEHDEMRSFAACIRAFVGIFEQWGRTFAIGFDSFVRNCYLLSGGLIGVVSKFMARLAFDLKARAPGEISFADCAHSAALIEAAGDSDHPAFQELEVPPIKLHAAYTFVLNEAGMRHLKTR